MLDIGTFMLPLSPIRQTHTCQDVLKRQLNVARIQSRRLDEAQVVLTGECSRLLCWHSSQVLQIALVSHQHDNDIAICMIPQLLQPPRHILIRLMLADIVNKERTNSTTVVRRGYGAITLLTSSVPDLSFDCFGINLDATSGEFDTDCGL